MMWGVKTIGVIKILVSVTHKLEEWLQQIQEQYLRYPSQDPHALNTLVNDPPWVVCYIQI